MEGKKAPIVLTTDFGLSGYHVGAMKGVILSRNPQAVVVDLCHGIPAGDVAEGAWTVLWNWRFFPPGTVHLVVVDPGVGTSRRALAAAAGGQYFVGPDNGILSPVLAEAGLLEAVFIEHRGGERGKTSATFHGRDVFAPAAAEISLGALLTRLGPPAERIVDLELPRASVEEHGAVTGEIIAVDPFGNLVTSITVADLAAGGVPPGAPVLLERGAVATLRSCYSDAVAGEAVAVVNSSGHLELAVNGGRADIVLGAGKKDRIRAGRPESALES